jgi:CO/xanthine dehydrogenase Mo-binding subunit
MPAAPSSSWRWRCSSPTLRPLDLVHAKLWRSPLPHARLEGIDTRATAAAPGMLAILKELAEMFGLSLSHVQVIVPYLGGAYDNKSYTKIEPLVVAMAHRVGRPVRLALTVEESFKIVR